MTGSVISTHNTSKNKSIICMESNWLKKGCNTTKFTRAKTIGEDYTEERLKERITERESIKTPIVKKRIGNVIDMNTNAMVKESKGYEYWATKHNLNTMTESIIFIREHGIKSVTQLDDNMQKAADARQNLQDKIKAIYKEIRSFLPLWSKFILLKIQGILQVI